LLAGSLDPSFRWGDDNKETWAGGAAFLFIGGSSWVAIAGDDRGTMVEVYGRGMEMHPTSGANQDAIGVHGAKAQFTPTHIALGTRAGRGAIFALGHRAG